MKNLRIIGNVGHIVEGNGTKSLAFLANELGSTNYGILVLKEANTDINQPKGWGLVPTDSVRTYSDLFVIPTVYKNLVNIDPENWTDELNGYLYLKSGVVTNGATLFVGATNLVGAAPTPIPGAFTLKGEGITDAMINSLVNLDTLPTPTNGTPTSGTGVIPVSNLQPAPVVFYTLDKNPIMAAKQAFASPIEYAKENPISAGVMVIAGIEVGNKLKLWKFSLLKKLGIKL